MWPLQNNVRKCVRTGSDFDVFISLSLRLFMENADTEDVRKGLHFTVRILLTHQKDSHALMLCVKTDFFIVQLSFVLFWTGQPTIQLYLQEKNATQRAF